MEVPYFSFRFFSSPKFKNYEAEVSPQHFTTVVGLKVWVPIMSSDPIWVDSPTGLSRHREIRRDARFRGCRRYPRVLKQLKPSKGVFNTVCPEAYRRYIPPVLPVPDTAVSQVRHHYRYRKLRYVRYDINTGTGNFGEFGTTSTPVPAEVIDVEVEKKAVPMILPAPTYNSRTGDVHELPAETIKAVDDFPVPADFRRERTREAWFMDSIGVYVEQIDEKTAPCKYFFCLASTSCRQQETVIPCKGRDRANVNKILLEQHTYQDK